MYVRLKIIATKGDPHRALNLCKTEDNQTLTRRCELMQPTPTPTPHIVPGLPTITNVRWPLLCTYVTYVYWQPTQDQAPYPRIPYVHMLHMYISDLHRHLDEGGVSGLKSSVGAY